MSHNQDVLGRAVDVGRSIELKPLATADGQYDTPFWAAGLEDDDDAPF